MGAWVEVFLSVAGKSSARQLAGHAQEIAPRSGSGCARESVAEVFGRGVGKANQTGPLHRAIVFLAQGAEFCEFASAGELARDHFIGCEPIPMFLEKRGESCAGYELVRPMVRQVDLDAGLVIGRAIASSVGRGSVEP